MGILVTLAGLIVLAYTISSAGGLWMSRYLNGVIDRGDDLPESMSDIPTHHLELMVHYSAGIRIYIWALSVGLLVLTLLALIGGSALAFWTLGFAVIIDVLLFMTCTDIYKIVEESSPLERLLDMGQCLALLASLAILMWVSMRISAGG